MAESDEQLCEMKELDLQPVELWEDKHSLFEQEVHEKSQKYSPNSPFYQVVSQIRGTFIIIINYYNTFPEFSNTQEALNLTFGALDELEDLKKDFVNDEKYYTSLLSTMKDLASKVHSLCFNTNNSALPAPQQTSQTIPKPSVLKKPVLQLNKKVETAKRKINDTNTGKKPRKEVDASTVKTQNKYQVLADPNVAEEATTSFSQVSNDSQCCEMETVESSETTVAARTAPKKEPRPPPITVLGHENLFTTNKEIKALIKGEMKVVNTRDGLRYYLSTVEDYRIVKKHFE